MPRQCVTCGMQELFLVHSERRISNLKQGDQGPVCGFCFLGPEITLQKRLEMSLKLNETMKRIEEVSK